MKLQSSLSNWIASTALFLHLISVPVLKYQTLYFVFPTLKNPACPIMSPDRHDGIYIQESLEKILRNVS